MEILKQPLGRPLSMAEQVITLCAANNKLFMGIPTKDVKKFQMDMLNYFATVHPEISEEIEQTKAAEIRTVQEAVDYLETLKDA